MFRLGEFVDALNRLHSTGRIAAFGGSNWSVARFKEANAYAAAKGLKPLTMLNNNLSLAVMEKPVWAGCITSNTPETLGFLRQSNTTHISWSSQARGYFLPEALRNRLPADTSPETCFGSPANAETARSGREARYKVWRLIPQHCHGMGAGTKLPLPRACGATKPGRNRYNAARIGHQAHRQRSAVAKSRRLRE